MPYRNAAVAERFGRENTQAMRNELRDRLDAVRPNEERPNDQRLMEGERDLRKDVAPAAPERREADVRRDMGARDLGEIRDCSSAKRNPFNPSTSHLGPRLGLASLVAPIVSQLRDKKWRIGASTTMKSGPMGRSATDRRFCCKTTSAPPARQRDRDEKL